MSAAEEVAVSALLAEADRSTEKAVLVMLGPVPAWVPPPVVGRAWRAACSLWADGTSPEEIRRLIDEELAGGGVDGEQASRPLPFVRTIYELASFVYGVSLGEREGLRFLAGEQAETGQRFKQGRKPGTVGPIRKEVARLLKKCPGITTPAIWKTIASNPPKGWQAFESAKMGKYLEGPDMQNVGYRRFQNICSEERKKA
jgi:hypothetical protein